MSINLQFKKTTVALAGNPYGRKIFTEQVEPKLGNVDEPVTIVFPEQISFITSSFVQGFFDFWLRTMSIDEIRKQVSIVSSNDRVKEYIWSNLE